MKSGSYGSIGPLSILKVKGSELVPGDIFTHQMQMKVVLRSYSLDHLRQQALDVESGEQDEDGEFKSPYRLTVQMDADYIILRADVLKECPDCGVRFDFDLAKSLAKEGSKANG